MRKFLLIAGLWLGVAMTLRAQVEVEVVFEQKQFLPGEAMPLAVRITNRSGQTLRLGEGQDWLTFTVESREGTLPQRVGDPEVAGEFTLESSMRAIKRVDFSSAFAFTQPNHYAAVATVRIPEWGREVVSKPAGFDIIQGARMWEQEFGVPPADGSTNHTPTVRKYVLQQANYLRGQLRLYARVVEPVSGRSVKVQTLGRMVSFSRPEAQVDRHSNLHVIYQNGPHTFSYSSLDPNGEFITRTIYEMGPDRPRLRADAAGNIVVTGGTPRAGEEPAPDPNAPLRPRPEMPPPPR